LIHFYKRYNAEELLFHLISSMMGCWLCAQQRQEPEAQAGQADPPDQPVFGLKKRQRFLLRSSWRGINRELKKTGNSIINKLLSTHPELLHLYPKYSHLATEADRNNNEQYQEELEKMMEEIDLIMADVQDQPERLDPSFRKLGESAAKVEGFSPQTFQYLTSPVLESVSTTLDERYTPQMETIYSILISSVIESLTAGFSNAGAG